MKVIILAGGLGTRLSEYTHAIPKPMVKIGNLPIIAHIMHHYIKYGFKEFIIAAGYKSKVFKSYFKNFSKTNKKFEAKIKGKSCFITIVDTGLKTLTGGRLKRAFKQIKNEKEFMFTYGDSISNINVVKLVKFHRNKKKLITVTAVRPPARFGEIKLKNSRVVSFKEKPQVTNGWINGGFFVARKEFIKYISGDKEILEKKPLELACKNKQLVAFKHTGFWKCMDVKRDKEELEKIYRINKFNERQH